MKAFYEGGPLPTRCPHTGPLTVIVTWRLSDLSTRAARTSPHNRGRLPVEELKR